MEEKLSAYRDAYFCFFAILFVGLAVFGGFRNYTSIPFWDMWNGDLDFYTKVSSGDWSAWWAQHNEHRIFLARIFFWLDNKYFYGQGWTLIITNYLLLTFSTAVFVVVGNKLIDQKENRYLIWFLVAWMFFWSQHDNLTWGFQIQFFLAFLLPLVSILLLWKSHHSKKSNVLFFNLSLGVGILCIGSMANGIIALPLLFVYSLLLKSSWRKSFILLLFSVLCISLYFNAYQSPLGHGSLIAVIKTDCLGLFRYMARYLGSPFSYVIGVNKFKPIVEFLGFFVLFFTAYQLFNNYLKGKTDGLNFALLMFVAYVIATAFGTAGGRLIFGLDQALESRYTTPAIMVWSIVFLILAQSAQNKKMMVGVLGVLLIFMLHQQLEAIENRTSYFTERSVAALSLALNVEDENQIKSILPSAKWGLELSKVPREKGYSIFGFGDIYNQANFMKASIFKSNSKFVGKCKGNVDSIKNIDGNASGFHSITGWVLSHRKNLNPNPIYFTNDLDRPVGVGYVGIERADVSLINGPSARYTGFKGYVKSNEFKKNVFIEIDSTKCIMELTNFD